MIHDVAEITKEKIRTTYSQGGMKNASNTRPKER